MKTGQRETFTVRFKATEGNKTIMLVDGDIYTAQRLKGFEETKLIGVVTRFGHEYAYPAQWFERVDVAPSPLIFEEE